MDLHSSTSQATRFDAVVIGGGPAGTTFGTLAAQAGRRVCVLERERFPRLHVGESLLPFNSVLFERLGVLDRLQDESRFIRKYGATFLDATGGRRHTFTFDRILRGRHFHTFQVERAEFDAMLFERCREAGADVRAEWAAESLIESGGRVAGVRARAPDGTVHEIPASLVVDASGRDTFVAARFGLRGPHPELQKACVWAHFTGVAREAGRAAGNIRIVAFEDGWAWVIPFHSGRTSVGLVLHGRRFKERTGDIGEFFDACVAHAPALAAILRDAKRVTDFQTISTVAYTCRQWAGDGWVLVGDAALFLDPVFSTGVLIAMTGAALVADTLIAEAGPDWRPTAATFGRYESAIRGALSQVYPLIKGFYDPPCMDQFMRPKNLFRARDAITSLLAGDVMPRLSDRLRRSVFWWGVRRTRARMAHAGQDVRPRVRD